MSVVVPVRNGAATLTDCLRALTSQSLPRTAYEVIVVDDGSADRSAAVVESFRATLLQQPPQGAAAARNAGIRAAQAHWIAFTDADCIPSRTWLATLLAAVERNGETERLGAAGRTIGHASTTPAARFVDLSGGLDAERHLAHPHFPFAPSGNVMYRRSALESVGGFDVRFVAYEACDLHARLSRTHCGTVTFEPRAIVLHRHRASWAAYWRQQANYGRGYGQFLLRYRADVPWSITRELRAWGGVAALGAAACWPGGDDRVLVRRGQFVKALAQRIGACRAYWSPRERARW